MGKRDVLKVVMLPLAVILAVVLYGCERGDEDNKNYSSSYYEGIMIGQDGGVVSLLNGDVVITIPEGALTKPTRFYVHDLLNKSGETYALKTIVIEPLIVFSKPVQLTLRYNGCLGNGLDLCEAESVSFLIWNDEANFNNQGTPAFCPSCVVNGTLNTICNCIDQTGVIATIAEW